MAIIIFISKKYRPKHSKTRFDWSDRSGIGFWSESFLNKYNNGHSSIHFIQILMLNSNLKSDIQQSEKVNKKLFKLNV
jgi:hypothetical protein